MKNSKQCEYLFCVPHNFIRLPVNQSTSSMPMRSKRGVSNQLLVLRRHVLYSAYHHADYYAANSSATPADRYTFVAFEMTRSKLVSSRLLLEAI